MTAARAKGEGDSFEPSIELRTTNASDEPSRLLTRVCLKWSGARPRSFGFVWRGFRSRDLDFGRAPGGNERGNDIERGRVVGRGAVDGAAEVTRVAVIHGFGKRLYLACAGEGQTENISESK